MMRIFVHEFVTGGGFSGRAVPASLAREGLAMRTALLEDLVAIGRHEIFTTTDIRFATPAPSRVEVVTLPLGDTATFDQLLTSADAVWLVAPETDRCLERLAARVERKGKILLGSGAAVVRRASDKAGLPRRLARIGVQHPETVTLEHGVDARTAARDLGYPVVLKPRRGAGSRGVQLSHNAWELRSALAVLRCVPEMGSRSRDQENRDIVMQRYVRGTPASVSLLADGHGGAVALAVNAQRMSTTSRFSYRGGRTPLDHPLAAEAMDAAIRTCTALPGLRGYVGVDLVLTDAGPVVIEVNARLTTAYLGVRAVLDENVAALALAACDGTLPEQPIARRRVRFTASGLVAAA
jgi:predicted ATP-grasp superfamily ATP-dependent carboligase